MINYPDYFVFDNKPSTDFNCYLVADKIHDSPERDRDLIAIPGRDGKIIVDNGRFENATISYIAIIYNEEYHLEDNLRSLKAYLLNKTKYCRLEDTFHPDEFYHAIYSGPAEPEVLMLGTRMVKIKLSFERKPQKYLKHGDVPREYTKSFSLFNSYLYEARPFIRVYGYGILRIGDYIINIAQTALPYIDIDCERQDAYYDTINCNNTIAIVNKTGEISSTFPTLKVGENNISLSGTISKIVITPRWWTI